MSEDEVLVFLISIVLAPILWLRLYFGLITVSPLGNPPASRLPLFLTPMLCGTFLLAVLLLWAARDVREHTEYIALFMVSGAATVGVALQALPLFGLSFRDDVVETPNRAARWVACALMLAVTMAFACANVGEGATIWMTLIPAALALSTLALLWLLLECFCSFSEAITVERDFAAGLHLSGFLVANALILGRAVAGDFESWSATLVDFVRLGLPSVVLSCAAIAVELKWRSDLPLRRSDFVRGVLPASFQVFVALFWTLITR